MEPTMKELQEMPTIESETGAKYDLVNDEDKPQLAKRRRRNSNDQDTMEPSSTQQQQVNDRSQVKKHEDKSAMNKKKADQPCIRMECTGPPTHFSDYFYFPNQVPIKSDQQRMISDLGTLDLLKSTTIDKVSPVCSLEGKELEDFGGQVMSGKTFSYTEINFYLKTVVQTCVATGVQTKGLLVVFDEYVEDADPVEQDDEDEFNFAGIVALTQLNNQGFMKVDKIKSDQRTLTWSDFLLYLAWNLNINPMAYKGFCVSLDGPCHEELRHAIEEHVINRVFGDPKTNIQSGLYVEWNYRSEGEVLATSVAPSDIATFAMSTLIKPVKPSFMRHVTSHDDILKIRKSREQAADPLITTIVDDDDDDERTRL